MLEIINLKHGTPEWLEFRKTGIGGSDASAILGLNPYKTNIELWEEKTGLKEPKAVTSNVAIEYGNNAEKHLVNLFKLDYPQYKVTSPKSKMYRDGFMFASLDGMLKHKKTGKNGVLEVKTAELYAAMHKEKWRSKVPDNYYIQVLHYLAVTGWEYAYLKAQLKTSNSDGDVVTRAVHYTFDIKDEQTKADIDYLKEQELEFWGYVIRKERPPLRLPQF